MADAQPHSRYLCVLVKYRNPRAKRRKPCFWNCSTGDGGWSLVSYNPNFIASPLSVPYIAKARPMAEEKEMIGKARAVHFCGFTGHNFWRIIKQKMAFSPFTSKYKCLKPT